MAEIEKNREKFAVALGWKHTAKKKERGEKTGKETQKSMAAIPTIAPVAREQKASYFDRFIEAGKQIAVLAEAAAVADAVRAADVDRLVDRLRAVGLTGVDRDVDVVVAHELERRAVVLRRVVVLGAGEIEADDGGAAGEPHRAGRAVHNEPRCNADFVCNR